MGKNTMKRNFFYVLTISICSALLLTALSTFLFFIKRNQNQESIILSSVIFGSILFCSISHIQSINYSFLLKQKKEVSASRYRFFLANSCFNFIVSFMFLFGFIEKITNYSLSQLVGMYFPAFSINSVFYFNVIVYGVFGMPSFFLQLELRNRLLKRFSKQEDDIINSLNDKK
jgi:hypothetical protein